MSCCCIRVSLRSLALILFAIYFAGNGLLFSQVISKDQELSPAFDDSISSPDRKLVEEYPLHCSRICDFYRSIQLEGIWEVVNAKGDSVVRKIAFRSNCSSPDSVYLRFDQTRDAGSGPGTGYSGAGFLIRPNDFAVLKRRDGVSSFSITQLSDDPIEGESVFYGNWWFLRSPFTVHFLRIDNILQSSSWRARFPDTKVSKVTRKIDDSKMELVTVEIEGTNLEGQKLGIDTTFNATLGWVITHFEVRSSKEVKICDINYTKGREGIGLLKKVDLVVLDTETRKQLKRETLEIAKIVPGPVSTSEFSLEAYGIRGPNNKPSWWSWRILLGVVGVGAVAIFFVLKWRQSYH